MGTGPTQVAQIVGDGVTDDSGTINAVIGAAPATGETIVVPSTKINVARCAAPILVNKPNIVLQLSGGLTLKAAVGLNADLLQITANNVFVWGGILDGNKANNATGTGATINAPGAGTTVSGVTLLATAIQNTIGYGCYVEATGAGASTLSTLLSRITVTNTNTGVFINGRAGGAVDMTTVRDYTVNTTVQHAVISTGANRTIFDAGNMIGAGLNKVSGFSHGIAIDGNSGTNANQEHRITNNRITTPYDAGIEVADSISSVWIGGNTILGAGNGAAPAATYGLYAGGGFTLSQRIQIVGNNVTTSKGHGIMVSGVDATHLTVGASIVANTSTLNGNDGIFVQFANLVEVLGNTSQSNSVGNTNSFSGIDFNVVTNSTGIGNVCTDTQGVPTQSRGINERGASDWNLFVGNNVRGNVTAPFITMVGAHTAARSNPGFNPVGALGGFPAFPATTVAITNNQNVDVDYYITAGAGTILCKVDGITLFTIPANAVGTVRIPAGSTFTPTYAVAPALVVPYGE